MSFLHCRGLEWIKRSHLDFSRWLSIPQYIRNVTKAAIQSALATASKCGWTPCKEFCVQTVGVGGGSQAVCGREARSKPLLSHHHPNCWAPLIPEEKPAIIWAFCGTGLDPQRARNDHPPLEGQGHNARWTKALTYSDKPVCNCCKAKQRLEEYPGIPQIFWPLLV